MSLAEAKIRWDAEYRTGFHARETNQAETWRWTTGEAVMSFRNPRADASLNLVVNGRPQRFETPQDVSVWVDDQMVDRFDAASPGIMTRTVPLDRALMGGSESFVVEVPRRPHVRSSFGHREWESGHKGAGHSCAVGDDRTERSGATAPGSAGDERKGRDREVLSVDTPAGPAVGRTRDPRVRGPAAPGHRAQADRSGCPQWAGCRRARAGGRPVAASRVRSPAVPRWHGTRRTPHRAQLARRR